MTGLRRPSLSFNANRAAIVCQPSRKEGRFRRSFLASAFVLMPAHAIVKTSQHERPRSEKRQALVCTPEEAAGAGLLLASPQAIWAVASSKVECSPKASVPAAHPQEACSGVAKLCFRNIPPIPFDAKSPP